MGAALQNGAPGASRSRGAAPSEGSGPSLPPTYSDVRGERTSRANESKFVFFAISGRSNGARSALVLALKQQQKTDVVTVKRGPAQLLVTITITTRNFFGAWAAHGRNSHAVFPALLQLTPAPPCHLASWHIEKTGVGVRAPRAARNAPHAHPAFSSAHRLQATRAKAPTLATRSTPPPLHSGPPAPPRPSPQSPHPPPPIPQQPPPTTSWSSGKRRSAACARRSTWRACAAC